jgi:RNA polymerase sigma factor (TIGR02999 family)
MRRILVDLARSRQAERHGGAVRLVALDEASMVPPAASRDILAVDEALTALAQLDERRSRIVELRFFGGLSVEETAEVLKISPATVMRDWKRAQAWLYAEISRTHPATL